MVKHGEVQTVGVGHVPQLAAGRVALAGALAAALGLGLVLILARRNNAPRAAPAVV